MSTPGTTKSRIMSLLLRRRGLTHRQQLTCTIKSTICWLSQIIQSIENRIAIKVLKNIPDHLEERTAGRSELDKRGGLQPTGNARRVTD